MNSRASDLYLEVPESHVLPLDVEALGEELGDLAHGRPPAERRVVRVVTLRRLSLGCNSMAYNLDLCGFNSKIKQ